MRALSVIEDAAHLAWLGDLVCLPMGGGGLLQHAEVAGVAQHDRDELDPLAPVVQLAEFVHQPPRGRRARPRALVALVLGGFLSLRRYPSLAGG
jgi:hypothetical protein